MVKPELQSFMFMITYVNHVMAQAGVHLTSQRIQSFHADQRIIEKICHLNKPTALLDKHDKSKTWRISASASQIPGVAPFS